MAIGVTPLIKPSCLWPGCVRSASYEVWGADGGAEGEFCSAHAHAMVNRLKREDDVNLYEPRTAAASSTPDAPGERGE